MDRDLAGSTPNDNDCVQSEHPPTRSTYSCLCIIPEVHTLYEYIFVSYTSVLYPAGSPTRLVDPNDIFIIQSLSRFSHFTYFPLAFVSPHSRRSRIKIFLPIITLVIQPGSVAYMLNFEIFLILKYKNYLNDAINTKKFHLKNSY